VSGRSVATSRIVLERVSGSVRRAILPAGGASITYGVHGGIAAFYGVDTTETGEHPSPLDHIVAAIGAALLGGFGRQLSLRGIPADERLTCVASGDIEADDDVLFIERVTVAYTLSVNTDVDRDAIDAALRDHVPLCPVTRTLGACIDLITELELVVLEPDAS
jgi:uncharacterized OsmC-like protein